MSTSPGPILPRSPGLRVPDGGYWTRVRMDELDLIFPYSWADLNFLPAKGQESAKAIFRLEGAHAHPDRSGFRGDETTGLRLILPIDLPAGTDAGVFRDGFRLNASAMTNAHATLRSSAQTLWHLELEELIFLQFTPQVMMGQLQAKARRGVRGPTVRPLKAYFIAYRAP